MPEDREHRRLKLGIASHSAAAPTIASRRRSAGLPGNCGARERKPVAELSVTRRRFLQATGWTAAGVTLIYLGGRHLLSVVPSFDMPDDEAGDD